MMCRSRKSMVEVYNNRFDEGVGLLVAAAEMEQKKAINLEGSKWSLSKLGYFWFDESFKGLNKATVGEELAKHGEAIRDIPWALARSTSIIGEEKCLKIQNAYGRRGECFPTHWLQFRSPSDKTKRTSGSSKS
ncbi:hypothetical protein Tco_0735990 [Tanacetum coccineum]